MADEPTNDNVEEVVEDQSQPAPKEQPEATKEEASPEAESTAEEAPQEESTEEAPEEKPPSRREQLRVQQLLKRYGQPPQAPSQDSPDFRSRVEADEEVYKTLEETAKQYGSDQFNSGLNQAEFRTWQRFLKMDENQVRSKYDLFNPDKTDVYHPVAEKALQEKYLRFVGFDQGDPSKGISPSVQSPDISYSDFVEAEMELADELAAQRTTRTTQNIAKQAATTGLRPDGSSPKRLNLNKAPEDMTDEELQAAVTNTMPRDTRGRFTKQ